uniref:Tc1-like transposase DDE domain-containing protein n=1 Tax=Pygocentrus nattereri TaxID=42514 RepID=A0A3B4BSZ1_PYGNA
MFKRINFIVFCKYSLILNLIVRVLDWPACSPDPSLIENVWHIMKHKIQQRSPQTVEQLKLYIKQEWERIPPTKLQQSASFILIQFIPLASFIPIQFIPLASFIPIQFSPLASFIPIQFIPLASFIPIQFSPLASFIPIHLVPLTYIKSRVCFYLLL